MERLGLAGMLGLGAALTYARRYSLFTLVGIADGHWFDLAQARHSTASERIVDLAHFSGGENHLLQSAYSTAAAVT